MYFFQLSFGGTFLPGGMKNCRKNYTKLYKVYHSQKEIRKYKASIQKKIIDFLVAANIIFERKIRISQK